MAPPMLTSVAILLVSFSGPTGQRIDVNPSQVTSVRDPQEVSHAHIAKGTHCLLGISNGKIIAVREDCDAVREQLRGTMGDSTPCVLVCGRNGSK